MIKLFFFVILSAFAKEKPADLLTCKTKADCVIIDINCGKPGVVNKQHKTYSENEGCDAAMDFALEARRYTQDCVKGQCVLVER